MTKQQFCTSQMNYPTTCFTIQDLTLNGIQINTIIPTLNLPKFEETTASPALLDFCKT